MIEFVRKKLHVPHITHLLMVNMRMCICEHRFQRDLKKKLGLQKNLKTSR